MRNIETIFVMIETNMTCMEAVEPKAIFIHLMGYEVDKVTLEGYA